MRTDIPMKEPDFLSKWVPSLIETRVRQFQGAPDERRMLVRVVSHFVPHLLRVPITRAAVEPAFRATAAAAATWKPANPYEAIYSIRYSHWVGGLAMGCCAGFEEWLVSRPARLHESEASAQLARIFCRSALRRQTEPHAREAYQRLLDAMRFDPLTVAELNLRRDRLIEETRTPTPEVILASEAAWNLVGGFHEGAWMTVGVIRNAPKSE